jgi:hypothetical protein
MRHHELWLWSAAGGNEVMLTSTNWTWLRCPLIYLAGLLAWGLLFLFVVVIQGYRTNRCGSDHASFEKEDIVSATLVSEDRPPQSSRPR